MAQIIRMPEVLAGATEAVIQSWLVTPGTTIAEAQPLADIETDKANVEFQSESAGVIGRLLADEGDTVAVGAPILVLLAQGEDESAVDGLLGAEESDGADARHEPEPKDVTEQQNEQLEAPSGSDTDELPDTAGAPAPRTSTGAAEPAADTAGTAVGDAAGDSDSAPTQQDQPARDRLFASPLVRRLAKEQDIDLRAVPGTGPNQRVTRRDLEKHLSTPPETDTDEAPARQTPAPAAPPAAAASPLGAGHEDVPLDRMRRTIARRLTESKSTVPHFYMVAECRVDALLALRTQLNEAAPRKLSVNDFVIKAVAGALTEIPAANAIWNGDSIRRFDAADISVAVATDGGLLTPVARDVARTPLSELSATVADLAERARSGKLKQHELEGGSFAVSNLGMYGITEFSAILNPPQSGILGVGAARRMPVVNDQGELEAATVMTVTLSADHRVLDGAVAAEWLRAFQRRIENPLTILI